jgi:Ca-activated chloride channel family protein
MTDMARLNPDVAGQLRAGNYSGGHLESLMRQGFADNELMMSGTTRGPAEARTPRPDRARRHAAIVVALATLVVSSSAQQQAPPPENPEAGFRFKSGVELINVSAVVSDAAGRFVPGLLKEDFLVYEDDQPQPVTHFSAERVPVSLGIALDTSGSMVGERIRAAQTALDRFLYDLLAADDEIFLYRFSDRPVLVQGWTMDRQLLSGALGRIAAAGTTAMYDAVGEAVRLAATGQNRKKALVLLSDGNDTTSRTSLREVKQLIRESEALVYAIGIDCGPESDRRSPQRPRFQRRGPMPIPWPFPPGGRRGWPVPPQPPPIPPQPQGRTWSVGCSDPVDVSALRDLTDDSGGRTEIVRDPQDLNPATARIADELSKQYFLGYLSAGKKDGRWHAIRVELRNRSYRVRARRGYVAS